MCQLSFAIILYTLMLCLVCLFLGEETESEEKGDQSYAFD